MKLAQQEIHMKQTQSMKLTQSAGMGKKGLEMQQLILLLLAILLLLFLGAWFFGLDEKLADLLEKFANLLGW